MYKKVSLKYDFNSIIEYMNTSSKEIPMYGDKSWTLGIDKEKISDDLARYNNAPYMTAKNTSGEVTEYNNSFLAQLDFEDIGKQLGMKVVSIWTLVQRPGQILPLHTDKHAETRALLPDHPGTICRAVIHLEDWHPGQFIDYNGDVETQWTQGDGHMVGEEVPHASANCGDHPKYTMQVNGYATNNII